MLIKVHFIWQLFNLKQLNNNYNNNWTSNESVTNCSANQLVEVLPEILGHEPEGAEQRPPEVVEVRVVVVRVEAGLQACVALPTGTVRFIYLFIYAFII